jgi:hypothetical protein
MCADSLIGPDVYKVVQRLLGALERQRRLLSITDWMKTFFFVYYFHIHLVVWYK